MNKLIILTLLGSLLLGSSAAARGSSFGGHVSSGAGRGSGSFGGHFSNGGHGSSYTGGARAQGRVASHATFNGYRLSGSSSLTRVGKHSHGLSKKQLKSLALEGQTARTAADLVGFTIK